MKVRELIEALSRVDPELEVVSYVGDWGYDSLDSVELIYLGVAVSEYYRYDAVEPSTTGAFEALLLT